MPELGTRSRGDTLRTARADALDAEDLAASLERRLLLALGAQLDAHPELTAPRVEDHRAELAEVMARALPGADDPTREATAVAAAWASEDLRALDGLVHDIMLRGAVPGAKGSVVLVREAVKARG